MEMILIFTGFVICFFGYKLRYSKPKYNFEKSTSGRTIKFLDYSGSKKLARNKILGILIILLGFMIIGVGFWAMFFAE